MTAEERMRLLVEVATSTGYHGGVRQAACQALYEELPAYMQYLRHLSTANLNDLVAAREEALIEAKKV
jgi:hypothetical protein